MRSLHISKTFYRGGGYGSIPRNIYLSDILKYEKEELGNTDIYVEPNVDPEKVSSNNLIWVCEDKQSAENYGEISKINIEQYRIVARDSEGGLLVERLNTKTSKRQLPFPEMSEKHFDDVKWKGNHTSGENNYFFHVTPSKNLNSIFKKGLLPKTPKDIEDKKAVYLFPDKDTAEEALLNWLGDRFEDTDLTLLKVNKEVLQKSGIEIIPGDVDYEVLSLQRIPPEAISVEEIIL
jgi:hypothetical protein